jgi:hypothetical protein
LNNRGICRDSGFPIAISRVMNLDLTDDEKAALMRALDRIIRNDRYPLGPRIQLLKSILGKLRPEPIREPLSP